MKYNAHARPRKEEDEEEGGGAFHVSCMEGEESRVFNIFVYGPIESAKQFIPAVEALMSAKPDDVVFVHLSTPGGSVNATDTFLTSLANCLCDNILFVASGGVCSAGTIILMWANDNGYEIEYSPGFYAMVHTGSFGFGGKTSDFKSAVRFLLEKDEAETWATYKGFLSDEEVENMLFGREYWFDEHEFKVRLQKRNEILAENEE